MADYNKFLNFFDLEEIDKPEDINKNDKSPIDSIKFATDNYSDELDLKLKNNRDLQNEIDSFPKIKKSENIMEDLKTDRFKKVEPTKIHKVQTQPKMDENIKIIDDGKKNRIKKNEIKSVKIAGNNIPEEIKSNLKNKIITDKEIEKRQEATDLKKTTNDSQKIEDIEELEEVLSVEENPVDELVKKVDLKNNKIEYPGKINIEFIDKKLLPSNLQDEKTEKKDEESFGVNRVEVFYNIDKNIYSSRSSGILDKNQMENVKKGIFIPLITASSLFVLLFVSIIFYYMYLKSTENITLEESFQKENSILVKIAQKQREEARLARLKLEQERKSLEKQKSQIESTINEELLKKQAEIEGRYKQKLLELQNKGVSQEELEKYKQRYEEEKNRAYEQAKQERDQQLAEQSKNLEEKEKNLKEALDKVKTQSESYQADLAIIRKQYEEKSRQDREVVLKELNKIRENDEKIKSFNNNIYQLISGSMMDFKNQNYDNAVKKLDAVLKYYKDNELFVNSNDYLKNKMETDIFFVDTIAGLITQTKKSPVMTKEYNDIINKLEKLTNSYKSAEAYYNLRNFDKSSQEYTKVLAQFEEVNKSSERLKLIEKVKQNNIAKNLYDRAQTDFNAKNYDAALNNLSSLIKNAPLSDYVTTAMNDINKIVALTSSNSKISKDNEAALKIFDQAENFKNTGNYNDALKAYYSIIATYPYSDYTKKSYDQTIVIKDILENQKIESINNKIKDSFKSDFEKYKNAYNNGDLASARRYYFDALKKAFDIYTNNSIGDFKSVEDKYIENLLASKDKSGVKNENQLTENEKKMLADLKKEKSDLEAKYKKLIDETKNTSSQDKDKKIREYELQLKTQNDQIENLRKYIEEKEKNISPNDLQKKINDYQDELRIEKEKAEVLKKQLYNYYQKENQYKDQQDKINSLENEIVKLKNSYKNLEEKSKSKTISNEDRLKIEKEMEEEKQKIKEYYEKEIARLKEKSVNVEKNTFNISDLTNTSGLIFGQVKDIVEDSVTFQFIVIDQSIKNLINNGDIVKIVRLSIMNNNKQENLIGYLQINSLKSDSQYGRGKIVSIVKGYEIQTGDLLKK